MKYKVEIEETVSQVFEICADTEEEALRLAEQEYKTGKLVLEPGNLMDVKFNAMESET